MVMYQLALQATIALAIPLIEGFEGVETNAYVDNVGVPTICAGMTRYPDGSPVRIGDKCSRPVCRAYLQTMIEEKYIPKLMNIPGWERLGKCRRAALVSFAWNLGPNFYGRDGFESISEVLRAGAKNPEEYRRMPEVLGLYTKAKGVELEGLKIRRAEEGRVWSREDDGEMIFSCSIATFLQKAPISSRYLSSEGRQGIEPGETIEVVAADSLPASPYQWITIKGSGERWTVYQPHWLVKAEGEEVEPVEGGPIDWSNFNQRITKYLTVGEVLQWDSRRRPSNGSKEEEEIISLAKQFDLIREAWGGPIGVVSGYRPDAVNREVGGVAASYHIRGMALDVYPVGESCKAFHKWLSRRWTGGLGDGCSRGFVHIDTRDEGRFAPRADARPCCVWSY
ncbi:MAG: hypothetical protein CMJ39_00020 [Phycisphaerae bacterium]|nr:hypothetical protein [Phycisphaerae bacterium]|tara:strand:- start:233 stop:1417 length:1185 start_codon:yes stop_codon:yes gene_type:complete